MVGWAKTEFAASAQVVVGWAKLDFAARAQVVVGWAKTSVAIGAQVVMGWTKTEFSDKEDFVLYPTRRTLFSIPRRGICYLPPDEESI